MKVQVSELESTGKTNLGDQSLIMLETKSQLERKSQYDSSNTINIPTAGKADTVAL